MLFVTFVGFCFLILLTPFEKIPGINKLKRRLDRKLKWNFTIRLILEGLLEISFTTIITIRYVQLDRFGGYFNYILAWVLLSLGLGLFAFIMGFYLCKFERMSDPFDSEFHSKYGAPYSGLKTDKKMSLF